MKLIKDLPEVFEEFASQRKESFITIKELKDQGIPVVGSYCTYFPKEIPIALGAATVSLCSTSDETIGEAEKDLPRNLCPLIKSSYGFAKTDKCPYFYFSDIVVGETTCDGKKKMYEIMEEIKHMYLMELPNSQSDDALILWEKEVVKFKEYLEEMFDKKVSDDEIKKAISEENEVRKALKKLASVMKMEPTPISGHDLFKIIYGSTFKFDRKALAEELNQIHDKIMKEYDETREKKPRILITGCPIGGATEKVIAAVENNGGVVVAFENCSGEKMFDQLVDEDDPNIYKALAKRYLDIGCSVMTPDKNRFDLLDRMIDEYKVDGVVEMDLQACHTYIIETRNIRKFVNEEKNIPFIAVETDYSIADIGQLETRITAFLEMI